MNASIELIHLSCFSSFYTSILWNFLLSHTHASPLFIQTEAKNDRVVKIVEPEKNKKPTKEENTEPEEKVQTMTETHTFHKEEVSKSLPICRGELSRILKTPGTSGIRAEDAKVQLSPFFSIVF